MNPLKQKYNLDRFDRSINSWPLLRGGMGLGFGSRDRGLSILLSLRTMRCKFCLAWLAGYELTYFGKSRWVDHWHGLAYAERWGHGHVGSRCWWSGCGRCDDGTALGASVP